VQNYPAEAINNGRYYCLFIASLQKVYHKLHHVNAVALVAFFISIIVPVVVV
jgi:hypothetical protein